MSNSKELRQLARNGDVVGVTTMLSTLQRTCKKSELAKITEGKDELSGNTALHYCCANGHAEIATALINAGAPVDAVNNSGSTPLHYACLTGQLAVVRRLVDAGVDLVHRNNFEHTAMDQALQAGHRDVADFLMKAVEERAEQKEPEAVNEISTEGKEKGAKRDAGTSA